VPDSCAKARLTISLIQKQPTKKKFHLNLTVGFSSLSKASYFIQFSEMFLSTYYVFDREITRPEATPDQEDRHTQYNSVIGAQIETHVN
jgi:hypothetical protein